MTWCKPILGQLFFSKTFAQLLFSIIVKKYCFIFYFYWIYKKSKLAQKNEKNVFDILSLSFFNRAQFFLSLYEKLHFLSFVLLKTLPFIRLSFGKKCKFKGIIVQHLSLRLVKKVNFPFFVNNEILRYSIDFCHFLTKNRIVDFKYDKFIYNFSRKNIY